MTRPLFQAPAIHPEEGVNLVPDLLCALVLALALAQAAGATKTIMSNNMITSRVQRPNAGNRTPRMMMTDLDKNDRVFATFSAPKTKRGNCTPK